MSTNIAPLMTPRLRIFAGPNGSGKTIIRNLVESKYPHALGTYLNADMILDDINRSSFLNAETWGEDAEQLMQSAVKAPVLLAHNMAFPAFTIADYGIHFESSLNAYHASAIVYVLRYRLVEKRLDFSFETVMSDKDKVDFMIHARQRGYKTYLYFVATEDPYINTARVKERVSRGGHDVPEDKIYSRFYRSLNHLQLLYKDVDRAFIFDNSFQAYLCLEFESGVVKQRAETLPVWVSTLFTEA